MTLAPGLRKLALTAHVACSVGWIGAVVAYLALVVAALNRQDGQPLGGVWMALELIGWSVLVPLSLASLLTGLIQALGTEWGLFRHYWVVFKLGLTMLATIILLLHMPSVSHWAGVAAEPAGASVTGLLSERLHAGGGLLVLLAATILSVYKPRGVTPYGWRKQRERPQALRQSTQARRTAP